MKGHDPMKVAVTSQNFKTVTAHAGKTRRFLIYDATSAQDVAEVDRLDLPKEMSLSAYKGTDPHPIGGVDMIVTGGCGDGFRQRMARIGIGVVVTDEIDSIEAAREAFAA